MRFTAIQTGKADLGVIPIENSIAGRVADIHHLLPHVQPAHHRRALPADPFQPDGAARARRSRPSRRCRATSTRSASAANSSASITTRRSSRPTPPAPRARSPRTPNDLARAALAPKLAARIYGLKVLAENCADEEHNTTRFVILSKKKQIAEAEQRPGDDDLRVPRPQPARRALQGDGRLCDERREHDQARKLHARAATSSPTHVLRRHRRPPGRSRPVQLALEELKFFSRELRVLGVYPAHPFRSSFKEAKDRFSALPGGPSHRSAARDRPPGSACKKKAAAAAQVH